MTEKTKKSKKTTKPKEEKVEVREVNLDNSMQNKDKENTTKSSLLKSPRFKNSLLIVLLLALLATALYLNRGLFVAATVNGKPITRTEVIGLLESQGGSQALENLITKKLILQEAAKNNVQVSSEEINSEINKLRESLEAGGQSFEQILQMQGVSIEQVREDYEMRLMLQKLLGEKISVSNDEVNEYIETNAEAFPEGTDTESDEFKNSIKETLENQKFSTEVQTYLQQIREEANVQYWTEY